MLNLKRNNEVGDNHEEINSKTNLIKDTLLYSPIGITNKIRFNFLERRCRVKKWF